MPVSRKHSHNDTDTAHEPSKRTIVRATTAQLHELKIAFAESNRPTKEVKNALAERIGLTSTWVHNWFMRERKKIEVEIDKPAANNTQPNPRYPSVVSDSSAMTAPTSRGASSVPSLTHVTDWSNIYSRNSPRSSSSESAYLSAVTPPSHSDMIHSPAMQYPSQSFFPAASSTSTNSSTPVAQFHLNSQSESHYSQYAPYAHPSLEYNPLGYAAYYPRFAINHSLVLPPLSDRYTESGVSAGEKDADSGSTCANVKGECASTLVAQGEGADAGDDETEEEATPYIGSIAFTQNETLKDKELKNGAEEESESPLNEAAAWQKIQQHPQFQTLLEIAGVRGPFKLTEDGLIREGA